MRHAPSSVGGENVILSNLGVDCAALLELRAEGVLTPVEATDRAGRL